MSNPGPVDGWLIILMDANARFLDKAIVTFLDVDKSYLELVVESDRVPQLVIRYAPTQPTPDGYVIERYAAHDGKEIQDTSGSAQWGDGSCRIAIRGEKFEVVSPHLTGQEMRPRVKQEVPP